MRVKRLCAWVVTLAMIMTSLTIPSFAAEGDTSVSGDVYKASDAWYEPTDDAAENTYNNHTEWKWQRKDNNKDWYDFTGFKTDKNYFYPVAGETTGTLGGAWTTSSTAQWNHPGVGENWMQPLCAAEQTENAVSKAFTAPKDGVVKLSTEDGFICGGSTDQSWNAYVRITLNGEKIWPADGTTQPLTTSIGTVNFIPIYGVKVAKGDVLRFEAYNGTATSNKMYGKRVWWKPVVTYTYNYKASDAWNETSNTDSVWLWLYRDNDTVGTANEYVAYTLKGSGNSDGLAAPAKNEDGSYDYATKSGTATVFSDSLTNPGMRNALGQYWVRPSVAMGSEPKQGTENRIVKQFTAPKSGAVTISAEDMSGAAKIYNRALSSSNNKGAVCRIIKKTNSGDITLFEYTFDYASQGEPADGLGIYDFEPIRTNIEEGDKLWFEVSSETGGSAYAKQVFWNPVVAYEYEIESISPANMDGVPLDQSFTLTFAEELDEITADNISVSGGASVKSLSQSADGKQITVSFDGLACDMDYTVSISGVKSAGMTERFSGFSFKTMHATFYRASDAWSKTTNTDKVWRWLYRNDITKDTENPYEEYSLAGTTDTAWYVAPAKNEDGSYDYATTPAEGNADVFTDSETTVWNYGRFNAIGQYWARLSIAGSEPAESTENRIVKQFTSPQSGVVTISAEDMNGDAKIYNKEIKSEGNRLKGAVCRITKKTDGGDVLLFEHDFRFTSEDPPENALAVYDFEPIRTNIAEGDKLWFEISGETGGSAYAKQVFWDPTVNYDKVYQSITAENVTFSKADGTALSSFADVVAEDNVNVTLVNSSSPAAADKNVVMYAAAYDAVGNLLSAAVSEPTSSETITIENMAMPLSDTSGFVKVYLFDSSDSLNSLSTIGALPVLGSETSIVSDTVYKGKDISHAGEFATVVLKKAGYIEYIGQTLIGKDGSFRISLPDRFASETGITVTSNVTGGIYAPSIPLYVSASGTENGDGTEANPLTFQAALEQAEDGGTVIVKGNVALDENFTWQKSDKTVTVKGADENSAIDITNTEIFNIHSNAIFENLTIKCAQETDKNGKIAGLNKIAANGKHVIIKDSVKTSSVIGTIVGGSFKASVASTNLEVYGGNYNSILGGSHSSGGGAVHVNGDSNLTVGGNVNSDVNECLNSKGEINWDHLPRTATIHGGGYGGSVKGNSTLTLKDDARAKYVYGGQNGLYSAQTTGKITVNVDGGQYMNVFAMLKNTSSATVTGDNGQSSTVAKLEPTTAELNMTGGIAEGVIGAQEMTKGDITINALGGTITRRLIAGVYNDLGTSTDYYVDGTATVYVGPEISIMPDKAPLGRGINGGSRNEKNHSEEIGRLIFLGGSYDKNKDKITKMWVYPVPTGVDDCNSNHDYIVAASAGGSVSMDSDNVITITPENGNAAWVNKAIYEGTTFTPASGSITAVDFYSTGEEPKTLTVTLDAQGGSEAAVDSFMDKYVPSEGIALPDTSKTGYTFDGWYTAAADGTKVDKITSENLADIFGSEISATLYAHWTAKEYTITLDAAGGTGVDASIKGTVENAPTLPEPTKEGYTFAGWYTAETGGEEISQITAENIIDLGETTLYAQWTAIEYTVNLVAGDGTVENSSVTLTVEEVSAADFALPVPTPPHNYSFGGWWTGAETGDRVTKVNITNLLLASQNNTVTFYARYSEVGKYTVSYDANDGEDAPEDNNTYHYADTKSISIPQKEPQRLGYTFTGWIVDDGDDTVYKYGTENNEYSNFDETVGSIVFIAQWTEIEYTITLDLQGGIGISSLKIKGSIKKLPVLPGENPTKAGYTFDGWYTAETDGGEITAITVENIDELNETTLYAHWTAIEYTVNLVAGDGTVENSSVTLTVEDVSAADFALPVPTPPHNYNFGGWWTEEEGGERVTKANIKTLLLASQNNTVTFYARYNEVGKYTVSYDANGGKDAPEDNNTYYYADTPSISIPQKEPQKAGYTFVGWIVDDGDDTVYKYGTENDEYLNFDENVGSIVFIAQWTEIEYTITLDLQDGEGIDELVIKGTVENLPALPSDEPTKDGFIFKGWYTEATGGEMVEAITADNISELSTLYARWEEIQTDDYKIVSADRANNTVKVIKRTNESAYIIVALYAANGNLVKISIEDISPVKTDAEGENIDVFGAFDGDYAKARVFMWNNFAGMLPRCSVLPVNK